MPVQTFNLFNFNRESYKITKPVRLIELFGGIGAQAKAFERLGFPFEHWKLCEWNYYSMKAYNAIHIKDWKDYLALRNVGMSDSQIYHLTGDSIVVNVLENIFSQLY